MTEPWNLDDLGMTDTPRKAGRHMKNMRDQLEAAIAAKAAEA